MANVKDSNIKEKALSLRRQGITIKEIAETCKVSITTVNRWAKEAGLTKSVQDNGSAPKDYTGQRFHFLKAIEPAGKIKPGEGMVWRLRCDCGKVIESTIGRVNGKRCRQSCGCKRKELNMQQAFSMVESARKYRVGGTYIPTIANSGTVPSHNTSGVRGVSWHRKIKKWATRITFQQRSYHLGYYDDLEEAAAVRKEAEKRVFGGFLEWYATKKGLDTDK